MANTQNQVSQTSSTTWLQKLAVERAKILIGCCRKSDANDPRVYAAAVVAVLMRWPAAVINAVTEPATGIPSRINWLPSIAEITKACEEAYEPIRARLEIERTKKSLLPPPVKRLSQAELDAQFERLGLAHLRPGSKCNTRGRQTQEAQETLDRYAAEAGRRHNG